MAIRKIKLDTSIYTEEQIVARAVAEEYNINIQDPENINKLIPNPDSAEDFLMDKAVIVVSEWLTKPTSRQISQAKRAEERAEVEAIKQAVKDALTIE